MDISAYEARLKLTWLKRIACNWSNYNTTIDSMFDIAKLVNTGTLYAEKILQRIKNRFWIDVLKLYIKYGDNIEIKTDALNIPFFHDKHFGKLKNPIKQFVNSKPLFR